MFVRGKGTSTRRMHETIDAATELRAEAVKLSFFDGSFSMYQVETVGTIRVDGSSARSRCSAQHPAIMAAECGP